MSDIEVITHELDSDEGVYRLVVGAAVYEEASWDEVVDEVEAEPARQARDRAAALRAEVQQVRAEGKTAAAEVKSAESEVAAAEKVLAADLDDDTPSVVKRRVEASAKRADAVARRDRAAVALSVAEGNVEALQARAVAEEEAADAFPPEPKYERKSERVRVGVVPVEDFVFAAHDERWDGKSPAEVADIQRGLVAEALAERIAAAEQAAERNVEELPGVGEALSLEPSTKEAGNEAD